MSQSKRVSYKYLRANSGLVSSKGSDVDVLSPKLENLLSGDKKNYRSISFEAQTSHINIVKKELRGLSIVLSGWINILLIFAPFGILASYFNYSAMTCFSLNFLALIPLANLLGNATEELALHTGDIIGGLINATFGNAVEMIITFQALRGGMIQLVKSTLIGSVLSNLLLVLGMSFFCAGVYYKENYFNIQGVNSNTSLLLLSCLGLILPTMFSYQSNINVDDILNVSRVSSILLMVVYILFIVFQLRTHAEFFRENQIDDTSDDPVISFPVSVILLIITTLLVSISSDLMINSIEIVVQKSSISEAFIGMILLPLVGNATEHWIAIRVAMKGKLDLSISVAAGSSTQIALFVIPFSILIGWILNQPMSLNFSLLEMSAMFVSVVIVMAVVHDGRSNWLEGAMLIIAYILYAIVFWYSPVDKNHKQIKTKTYL